MTATCAICHEEFDNAPKHNQRTGDQFVPKVCFKCWIHKKNTAVRAEQKHHCGTCGFYVFKHDPKLAPPAERIDQYCQAKRKNAPGPGPFFSEWDAVGCSQWAPRRTAG